MPNQLYVWLPMQVGLNAHEICPVLINCQQNLATHKARASPLHSIKKLYMSISLKIPASVRFDHYLSF